MPIPAKVQDPKVKGLGKREKETSALLNMQRITLLFSTTAHPTLIFISTTLNHEQI
jgi:hypothetical protein